MQRQLYRVDGIANAHLYSAAARFGNLIFTSGHTASNEVGQLPGDFAAHVEGTFDNLERVLLEAGAGLDTVLKIVAYLADIDDFDVYNEHYQARFKGLGLPARTTIQVGRFSGGLKIEIEAVAHVRESEDSPPAVR